jgi:hypothetical protein
MSNIQNQELFADLNTEESEELNGGHHVVYRFVTVWQWVRVGSRWFYRQVTIRRYFYA